MLNILIAILTGVISGLSVYAVSEEKISSKIRFIRPANEKEAENSKIIKPKQAILMALVSAVANGTSGYMVMTLTHDPINIAKLLAALYTVSLCSACDYKEHRIPNIFTGFLAVFEICFLAAGLITGQNGSQSYLFSAGFACIAVVVFMAIASFLSKGGLGVGDIKLLGALSLIGDIYLISSLAVISGIVCAVTGLVLLAFKKMSIKDGLPYAPFVYIGLVISIYFKIL